MKEGQPKEGQVCTVLCSRVRSINETEGEHTASGDVSVRSLAKWLTTPQLQLGFSLCVEEEEEGARDR